MAILPSQPGIKISIVDNSGTAFQEYPDTDAEHSDKVVSRYIEARSGAEFGIRWDLTAPWPDHTLLLYFYVDEKPIGGTYCRSESYGQHPYTGTHVGARSVVDGKGFMQKFVFAALDIDDSAVTRRLELEVIKGMGKIKVAAHFVKNLQRATPESRALQDSGTLSKISEKALKGQTLSHQIASFWSSTANSQAHNDHLRFRRSTLAAFRYLHIQVQVEGSDALKSLLIIPRSPSPVPLEERDVDTLSPEELREIVKRQRERDAAARAVKQEPGIKRERTEERNATPPNDSNDDGTNVDAAKKPRTSYKTALIKTEAEEIDLT